MAIQVIYDCSGIFPPLQTTDGVLLTISKVLFPILYRRTRVFLEKLGTEGKARGDARYINTDTEDYMTALSECASSLV